MKKQFLIWYEACMMFLVNEQHLLDGPRPKLAACLFFLGSIDYLCQNYHINDVDFAKISDPLLQKVGFPSWLIATVTVNFYLKDDKPKFALEANLEGGKRIGEFLRGENKWDPYVFSSLVREWAENPDLTSEEMAPFEQLSP